MILLFSPSHDALVYPPKMYSPTLTMVTVGFLLSQFEWKVLTDHPSLLARQHRFQAKLPPAHDFNIF